jgi:hypothetical protein
VFLGDLSAPGGGAVFVCRLGPEALKQYEGDKDVLEAAMEAGTIIQQMQLEKEVGGGDWLAVTVHHGLPTSWGLLCQPHSCDPAGLFCFLSSHHPGSGGVQQLAVQVRADMSGVCATDAGNRSESCAQRDGGAVVSFVTDSSAQSCVERYAVINEGRSADPGCRERGMCSSGTVTMIVVKHGRCRYCCC